MRENVLWFLNTYKNGYTKEQVSRIMHLIEQNFRVFLDLEVRSMMTKFDHSYQKFIAEYDAKYPDLELTSSYSELFFTKEEQLANIKNFQ